MLGQNDASLRPDLSAFERSDTCERRPGRKKLDQQAKPGDLDLMPLGECRLMSDRRFAFRFSATKQTGLGHALRCISLASHLPDPIFVVDRETAQILSNRAVQGPEIRFLDTDAPPGSWITQYHDITDVIIDTLYSGNTSQTAAEVQALIGSERRVTVIDSMPPDHFIADCGAGNWPDLLVTPYLLARGLRPAPHARSWIHGAGYAILSSALRAARQADTWPSVPRILVTCGGSDPTDLSSRITAILGKGPAPVDVVVGPLFPEKTRAALVALAHKYSNVVLHHAPESLVPLYQTATLVVGRPGLTRYEAACLGRAAIYLAESHHYGAYYQTFSEQGIADIYQSETAGGEDAFFTCLAALADPDRLVQASRPNDTARNAVDGLGAARVARAIAAIET